MAILVNANSVLQCTFGTIPSPLSVLPVSMVTCGKQPAATIQDHIPAVNIKPFGMCSAPTNPAVIAALGAPSACVPVTTAPWVPGSPTVQIGKQPALNSTSKCLCTWLGVISVTTPAQTATAVP